MRKLRGNVIDGVRNIVLFISFSCRILDDVEMYEQQIPFELLDYVALSHFLNHFLCKAIQESLFGQ